jgi:D-sedoheptulose 7-phosphate isomerase|tara:strand:- start:274 stop:837 length:564 start_codon:yes stop_codon:yes gene_type:complete
MVENDFYKDIISVLQKIEDGEDRDTIRKITNLWRHEYQKHIGIGKRIFIIGNGGSCAIAEHISTDLNKRCNVKALTLSNNSLLTALTNDYGQENALVEWMKINHFDKTDFLVAISSSGKSPNVLNAINHATDCLGYVLAIFGMDGESPFTDNRYEDNYIHIDSFNYGVIELTTEIILHSMIEELVLE